MRQITAIKDLPLRLAEVGKIKIGGKGEERTAKGSGKKYQLPKKYDHFVVTGLERDESGNFKPDKHIMEAIGESAQELDVMLLHDEPEKNLVTKYSLYSSRRLQCHGDGEKAEQWNEKAERWEEINCPCENLSQENSGARERICKPNAVLSVMLPHGPFVGGVYKFRTTSWTSIVNLNSAMHFIPTITGGILGGIPLKLVLRPKTYQRQGGPVTAYVVNLVFAGELSELLQIATEVGSRRAVGYREGRQLKAQIDRLLTAAPAGETEEDVADEFYPENRTVDGPPMEKADTVESPQAAAEAQGDTQKGGLSNSQPMTEAQDKYDRARGGRAYQGAGGPEIVLMKPSPRGSKRLSTTSPWVTDSNCSIGPPGCQ